MFPLPLSTHIHTAQLVCLALVTAFRAIAYHRTMGAKEAQGREPVPPEPFNQRRRKKSSHWSVAFRVRRSHVLCESTYAWWIPLGENHQLEEAHQPAKTSNYLLLVLHQSALCYFKAATYDWPQYTHNNGQIIDPPCLEGNRRWPSPAGPVGWTSPLDLSARTTCLSWHALDQWNWGGTRVWLLWLSSMFVGV